MKTLDQVLLLARPLVGVDLETTGTNPRKDRIVEIGLEIFEPTVEGIVVKEHRTLVNPTVPIPQGATDTHGITNEDMKRCRLCRRFAEEHDQQEATDETALSCPGFKAWPTFQQLAPRLAQVLTGVDIAGFSVLGFDVQCLDAEFKRHGVEWNYDTTRFVDGLRLKQIIQPRNLTTCCEEAGIPLENAHSALNDIKSSTRLIAHYLDNHPFLPRTVDALHELCFADRYDPDGKLRWQDGELVVGFGEHKGVPLRDVPRTYLNWIIRKDFSDKVKQTCRDALKNIYPPAPVKNPEVSDEQT